MHRQDWTSTVCKHGVGGSRQKVFGGTDNQNQCRELWRSVRMSREAERLHTSLPKAIVAAVRPTTSPSASETGIAEPLQEPGMRHSCTRSFGLNALQDLAVKASVQKSVPHLSPWVTICVFESTTTVGSGFQWGLWAILTETATVRVWKASNDAAARVAMARARGHETQRSVCA